MTGDSFQVSLSHINITPRSRACRPSTARGRFVLFLLLRRVLLIVSGERFQDATTSFIKGKHGRSDGPKREELPL